MNNDNDTAPPPGAASPSARPARRPARARTDASAPRLKVVGHLVQTFTQPDGSTVTNQAVLEEKPIRRPPHPYRDFMIASTEGMATIAKKLGRDLSGRDYRVLFYLLSAATFGNFIVPSQREVAAALDLNEGDVSRSFKRLAAAGIIGLDVVSRRDKNGPKRWHLANSLFWKGSAYSLHEVQSDERREKIGRSRAG